MQDPEALAELEALPRLPPLAGHVWSYFSDLSRTRQGGGMAISPLSRLEIHAWEEDEGITLERWERRAILSIDAAYLASQSPEPEESANA